VTMIQHTVQNSINGLSWAALVLAILVLGSPAPAQDLERYHSAVATQQQNRFNENAIKSFVYHVFALYDKHEDVSKFLPLLSDDDLEMRFPETTLRSKEDFKKWYAGIGDSIQSNTHQLEKLDVKILGNGKYEVDLIVLWQALTKENEYIKFRAHQIWLLRDAEEDSPWPQIVHYVVEEAKE
jgi:hypothetical protein